MKPSRAILWDVYGTLLKAETGDLASLTARTDQLLAGFQKVIAHFDLEEALCRHAPDKPPAEALRTLYLGRIETVHSQRRAKGIDFPEVRIEEIWETILHTLTEHGPSRPELRLTPSLLAREVALFFERAAGSKQLYPGACETLLALHRNGIRQGLLSNAQFYTRVELNELLRIQSDGAIRNMHHVFDEVLVFLSCDFGFAKPGLGMVQHARNVLGAEGIAADQCLCVGNDMRNDVWCAKQCGFATALFAGDPESVRWRTDDPRCAEVKPDVVIHRHEEVLQCV